jgi:CRISPR-associated protein Csd2
MCQTFYDVRAFGAVMTTGKTEEAEAKKTARAKAATREGDASDSGQETVAKPAGKTKVRQWNCGQVRGPIQMTFARSVIPILSLEHAITRCALTNAGDTGRESAGDDEKAATLQMGRKMTIPYGLYRAHGFISPHFAEDTKFTEADLQLLWRALVQMFEQDHSAARGQMAARGLYVFKHASRLGNAPAHLLQERVKVEPGAEVKSGQLPARSFRDFAVTVDRAGLPAGVELLEIDCGAFADTPLVLPAARQG